jgi:predicted esterase
MKARLRAAPHRAFGIAAAVVATGAGAAVVHMRWAGPVSSTLQATPSGVGNPGESPPDWCAAPFEPIPGGGCLAAAKEPGASERLVIYLHGRYARDAVADEMDRQRRLATRGLSRRFAVLALRGHLGTCTAPELASWFCWPSNERNADDAPAFVGAWSQALRTASERTGARRRFLLGFSNGGYFAGLLASRGLLEVEAVAIAHAGPVEPVAARARKAPLLLLSADDDIAQDDMIRLDEELLREKWPHDSYARAGGHGLTDEDIDAALTFFTRSAEPLPLQPPLPLHRPVHHVRDDGAAEASDDDAGEAYDPGSATQELPVDDPYGADD